MSLRNQAHIVLAVEGAVGVLLVLGGHKVEQQVVLDSASDVRLEPGVVAGVELGSDANVVGVGDLL